VALSKHDLPLKKMLYLYLRTAAKQNAAVALLVVQVRGRMKQMRLGAPSIGAFLMCQRHSCSGCWWGAGLPCPGLGRTQPPSLHHHTSVALLVAHAAVAMFAIHCRRC